MQQTSYHPERYRSSRPFFPSLYRTFRETCDQHDGFPKASGMMAIQEKLTDIWNSELDGLSFAERPSNAKRFNEEISMFSHVARCVFNGRNIFHLQPALSSLLRATDVDDVQWSAIKLLYSSFYLWFGSQKDWPLGKFHFVDGAYIETTMQQGIQITLTSVANSYPSSARQNFVRNFDPYYYTSFKFSEDEHATVGETLKATLENDPSFHPDRQRNTTLEQFQSPDGGTMLVPRLPKEQSGWYEAALEHQTNLPVFMQALRLVVNGLCFLSASPDDIVTAYPPQALELIKGGLQHSEDEPEIGKRDVQRLRKLGYTEIHFCGDRFVQAARQEDTTGTGAEVSPHRRRAFWRNQTCGPNNSERRPKWIRPTVVRKDKLRPDEDAPGHTYIV
jgi:hypothetical protein